MKVLLVSPYSDKLVGGITNWTRYIVSYQQENGGNVDLTLLNNENATQVMDVTNLVKRLFAGLSNYLPVLRQFKKKVGNEHYDVAHICTSASFGLIRDLMIVNAARKKGVKAVVHTHFGRIPQVITSKGWEGRLFRRLANRADCIAVMDKSSLKALQDNGYENVRFVPNPLSTDVQRSIEDLGEMEREPRKIVFAGHVLASKGLRELVEACREIYQVKVEILGKVSDETFREMLYQIGGKDSTRWLSIPGNKPFEEVLYEMKSCGVFVLPSYSEGFPNVILESMACGCPIVATSVGAMPEMLDADGEKPCGICVPPQNIEALRDAIISLLGDPKKAKELGENARKRVNEQYDILKVWKQLVGLWEEVMNER